MSSKIKISDDSAPIKPWQEAPTTLALESNLRNSRALKPTSLHAMPHSNLVKVDAMLFSF